MEVVHVVLERLLWVLPVCCTVQDIQDSKTEKANCCNSQETCKYFVIFPCSIPFYCQLLKSCVHKNPSCSWRILYRDTYTHTAQSCTKVVFFLSVKSLHHRILMILSFRVRYKTQACEQIYVTCLNRSRYLHSHSITSIICGLASFFEYFYNFVVVYLHSSIFIYWSISVRKLASVEYFSIII